MKWLKAGSQVGLLVLSLLLGVMTGHAATRASVDREQIGINESVRLEIQTDRGNAMPDFKPLEKDFLVGGVSRSQSVQFVNGQMSSWAVFTVQLQPRLKGVLTIPALTVGNERTQAFRVEVTEAVAGGAGAVEEQANADVMVEMFVDEARPYVQQSVGVVVRLSYARRVGGELGLIPPEGASMQQLGGDVEGQRQIEGQNCKVLERRYVVIPNKEGELVLPGAYFRGQDASNPFSFMGGGLDVRSLPQSLQVQALPENRPQPWLPVKGVQLRYVDVPQGIEVGKVAVLTLETVVEGAMRSQLQEIATPVVEGAQVFADPPEYEESFVNGRPQVRVRRRYSLVAERAGELVLPRVEMGWWDVAGGMQRVASTVELKLMVAKGDGGGLVGPVVSELNAPLVGVNEQEGVGGGLWRGLALVLGLLWVLTLGLLLRVWRSKKGKVVLGKGGFIEEDKGLPVRYGLADLRRALRLKGLDEVGDVLCGMAGVKDLDEVIGRLADADQRVAVEELRRSLWREGDMAAARKKLVEVFKDGPRWGKVEDEVKVISQLPPLYPSAK